MNAPVSREKLERFAALLTEAKKRENRRKQSGRGGLIEFVRYFWDVLEPQTPLVEGWPLEAICQHLEAVTFGEITRLLMNVPPGFMKSLLTDVFWPAWEWSAMDMPHLRYVTFSYAATLTERDNGRFRDLLMSPKFQALWGHKLSVKAFVVTRIANDKTGWKLASSVGGVGTGERGNRVVVDDPHNVKEAESDTVRTETVRWFQEAAENRLNDLSRDAIIVIMQRVHENDVSGAIIEGENYVHLMIPMEYEPGRHCETEIGWSDPREEDGELAWPERFQDDALTTFRSRAYMWAGQYQQRPEPRGGGLFKRDWWQRWDDKTASKLGVKPGMLPPVSYVLGILDTAYTEKEENDPSAMTILGLWQDEKEMPQVMLMFGWEEWLEFNPLVEKVAQCCRDFKVDRLLIESKASGLSVAQEMRRRYSRAAFGVETADPGKSDKVARAMSVTHLFEDGCVWAPGFEDGTWRTWAAKVIDQMAAFPKASHDDMTDTIVMGLKYLRDTGRLLRQEEHVQYVRDQMEYQKPARLPYDA